MKKNFLYFLIGVMTLLWAGAAWAAPLYYADSGHWYEAFTFNDGEGHNWDNARDLALAKGGYLATITSAGENTFVYSLIQEDKFWYPQNPSDPYVQGPWLGGYQDWENVAMAAEGWKWVTGEPWSYNNWANYEPNDYPYTSWPAEETGDQNYLHFFNNQYDPDNPSSTKWADTWEDIDITNFGGRTQGYVVEWNSNPIPLPASFWLLGSGLLGLAGYGRLKLGRKK